MTDWASKKCVPCEGGVPKMSPEAVAEAIREVSGWSVTGDGDAIDRSWNTGDFVSAVNRIGRVTEIAEREQHHPDVHLTGYRHLRIVLTTHAIGGLSENDFVLAAKIDAMMDEVAE